ncbi:MAG: TlpA disulfide reductase family protein [Acidobacteriota bacterium]
MAASQPTQGSLKPFFLVVGLAVALLVLYVARLGKTGTPAEVPAERGQAVTVPILEPATAGPPLLPAAVQGKVVVLHFWATWCPPCRAEFPEFARYARESADRGSFRVVAISLDQTPDPVGPFLDEAGGGFPVYMDSAGLAGELDVTAIPTTVVLDKKGRVAYRAQGAANWKPGGVPAVVEKLARE